MKPIDRIHRMMIDKGVDFAEGEAASAKGNPAIEDKDFERLRCYWAEPDESDHLEILSLASKLVQMKNGIKKKGTVGGGNGKARA